MTCNQCLVKPFPGFSPAAQLYCLNSNLPSLQALGSCCSAGHMCHTLTLPCQDPLARAKWARFGNGTAPSAHSLFLPAGRRGSQGALRAALPSWPAGRAFSSCPGATWFTGKGSSPLRQGPGAPTGLIPVPVCGNTHGTSALRAHPLLPRVLELAATGKARTSDSSEMGLYGVYCSKHFIILQWNVLWSAKYYC